MGWFGYASPQIARQAVRAVLLAVVVGLTLVACKNTPYTLAAAGPFTYPAN